MSLTMVSVDEATRDEREGRNVSLRYFGTASSLPHSIAQAKKVLLHNRVLRAHFHSVDQFQIFIGASDAEYENQPLSGTTVHYADAYSPYGPLSGGDPPMVFFTLRSELSDLTGYMPEERHKLKWVGKRRFHANFQPLVPEEFPEPGRFSLTPIIERDIDGLEALSILAGPSASIKLSSPSDTSGQFVFVADGAIEHFGSIYGVESLGWQDAGSETVEVRSIGEGARVFVLRLPKPSTVIQHDREIDLARA